MAVFHFLRSFLMLINSRANDELTEIFPNVMGPGRLGLGVL